MGEWAGATQALVEGFTDDAALVPTLRGRGVIRQGGWCSRRHCGTFVCSSCLWATATAATGVADAATTAAAAATATATTTTSVLGATAKARHGGAEAQTPMLGEPANCWGLTDEQVALLPTEERPDGFLSGQAHGQVSTWNCLYSVGKGGDKVSKAFFSITTHIAMVTARKKHDEALVKNLLVLSHLGLGRTCRSSRWGPSISQPGRTRLMRAAGPQTHGHRDARGSGQVAPALICPVEV